MPATQTAWIDCPRCMSTEPATKPAPAPKGKRGRFASCAACGTVVRVREITVRWEASKPAPRECPPECLNGKSDCTCRCGGRCHGMKVCLCRSKAPWSPPNHDCSTHQHRLF